MGGQTLVDFIPNVDAALLLPCQARVATYVGEDRFAVEVVARLASTGAGRKYKSGPVHLAQRFLNTRLQRDQDLSCSPLGFGRLQQRFRCRQFTQSVCVVQPGLEPMAKHSLGKIGERQETLLARLGVEHEDLWPLSLGVAIDLPGLPQPDPRHLLLHQLAVGAPIHPSQLRGFASTRAPKQGQQQVIGRAGVVAALLVPAPHNRLQHLRERVIGQRVADCRLLVMLAKVPRASQQMPIKDGLQRVVPQPGLAPLPSRRDALPLQHHGYRAMGIRETVFGGGQATGPDPLGVLSGDPQALQCPRIQLRPVLVTRQCVPHWGGDAIGAHHRALAQRLERGFHVLVGYIRHGPLSEPHFRTGQPSETVLQGRQAGLLHQSLDHPVLHVGNVDLETVGDGEPVHSPLLLLLLARPGCPSLRVLA
ncbi:hypothetical protein D3C71_1169080 [compost metagenome]